MNKPFKLDKDKKKRWIKALRSGKYKQGTERLKPTQDTFCCLGVAKEIGLCENSKHRPTQLVSPNFLPTFIQKELAHFNDCEEWSFKQIANWINKHL